MTISTDEAKALEWYRRAAEQGYAEAQFYLADCYASGEGVSQSQGQAAEWYRRAAEQGHADAQLNLAVCYELGTAQDETASPPAHGGE